MRFWRRPKGRRLSIYAVPPGTSGEGVLLIEKEMSMGSIRLTLDYKVTKNGEDFNGGTNWWAGLSDTDAAKMVAMAAEVEDAVKGQAGKGGALMVELNATLDGVSAPAGFLGPRTYSGLTLHGINHVEKQMSKIGERLTKMGEDHADKKEGKPKP